MKLIILAAGEGKRLRPLTDNRPKCLVNLKGKSLLSRQLSTIKANLISSQDIALVGGYRHQDLNSFGLQVFNNTRFSSTNMVSTLFCASDFIEHNEDLIISYGDIVYEEKILEALLGSDAELSVVADKSWEKLWSLRMSNPLDDAETFIMDERQHISELGKRPKSIKQVQAQYIGLIKVRKDMVQNFKDIYHKMDKDRVYDGQDFDNMYMTSFIQYLIDNQWEVKATLINNGWLEVDTIADLECYENLPKKSLDSYCFLKD